ncbi:hypothetical protein BST27_23375 [Mycobacterium intermedium]|uniref:Uncharacterized protein n=1 Tax=Mycobacterium intermedium TaxID=28445 RepID=A0A1E3S8U8_MYCIE|nr:hypothetical protein BHQ20_21110 [Mycobacterium intermedium]OPE46365.1 hypothetical protein BV508_26265 [Mycobacterium intermedium]ORA96987.1 hypothetical protein BST27_23375 [Mycobacterium intermedium]
MTNKEPRKKHFVTDTDVFFGQKRPIRNLIRCGHQQIIVFACRAIIPWKPTNRGIDFTILNLIFDVRADPILQRYVHVLNPAFSGVDT